MARPGDRDAHRPEPNTYERARELKDELNRTEPAPGFTGWFVGGKPPNIEVFRVRQWMPEDVEGPADEIEAEYLEVIRDQLRSIADHVEVRWLAIEIRGDTPDTQLLAVFEPRRAPGSWLGLRWRVWPLSAPTVSAATDYGDISFEEFFADGLGADARLGRITSEPGRIRWIDPSY